MKGWPTSLQFRRMQLLLSESLNKQTKLTIWQQATIEIKPMITHDCVFTSHHLHMHAILCPQPVRDEPGIQRQAKRWCCNLSGGVALIVWFTTNEMCVKNKNMYTWSEQAIIREIATNDLYCCLLPRCEALRTCHSGFPIASVATKPFTANFLHKLDFSREGSTKADDVSFAAIIYITLRRLRCNNYYSTYQHAC